MKSALIALLLALLISCATKQNTITAVTNTVGTTNTDSVNIDNEAAIVEDNAPQLIFINYVIEKTPNGNKNIRFINKIIADGKLKNTSSKYLENGTLGDLKCYQLDENYNILQSIVIANPFVKVIEYVDDSKTFQKRRIELDTTQFSLRLQLDPQTKYIAISDINDSKTELEPLIKTKIY